MSKRYDSEKVIGTACTSYAASVTKYLMGQRFPRMSFYIEHFGGGGDYIILCSNGSSEELRKAVKDIRVSLSDKHSIPGRRHG